uniref:FecR domain-containing protein n=1 Tax=Macrostomum lignano TaxID=282301 RepID=A0A1I8I2A6_9PLAT
MSTIFSFAPILCCLCCCYQLLIGSSQAAERPQIVSSRGNLYFEATDGKNIEFRPAKSGEIRVGEHNLLQLASEVCIG